MKKDNSQVVVSGMYGESIGSPKTDFSIPGMEPKILNITEYKRKNKFILMQFNDIESIKSDVPRINPK